MSKKFLLWLSLMLFVCGTTEHIYAASPAVEAYENKPVSKIDVTMENLPPNTTFDPKTIVSRLKTKTGDPFSQLTFDSDLKTLSEDYDRIEPAVEVQNGEVHVLLKLWARPVIRTIKWKGNSIFKTKALQKELGIKPHTIFNRTTFNQAFNKVKEYYVKKGYFESQLQYSMMLDPKTNEVDIDISVDEGRSGRIEDIDFKGFSSAEESEILQMIYTKKYNLFTSWVTGSGQYREEALEQDKLTIVNMLQNKGYADAKVDIQVKPAKSQEKIVLEITLDRGPVYHFGRVTFKGNTLFKDKDIEGMFLIHPEEIYSPEKLRDTAQAIKDLYGRKGRIEANVQYEANLVENAPVYNVRFEIDEGEEYKIGLIRVMGNVQTKSNVILRESLLVPGETFDSAKLKATQMRLENIGYFKNVNVYAVRTQDDQALGENYRDVYIEVEETTTGNLSLFFGFSTADDLFAGLDLVESNFNYKGFGNVWKEGPGAVRGGGEYAHARFSIGARQKNYAFSWLTPYFRDSLWRIGFDINKATSNLQAKDVDIDTIGGTVFTAYPVNVFWTFGSKYRIRYSTNHLDHPSDISKDEKTQTDVEGVISAIGSSIKFDSTDSAVKPHNGFRSILEGEFAGLGGNFSFFKFSYINSYYTQLWKGGIMKYRADLQFIEPVWFTNSPEKVPYSERFFLGGENSVRGYRAFDLGPHFDNGNPTGGISSSLFSVEYLHEIFRFLDGFVFADAGAISLNRWRPGTFRLSYGFGARIELINRVPIIMGMGFPVNPDGDSEVRKFFFSMGGQF